MKKWLSGLLALTLLLTVCVGCGSNNTKNSDTPAYNDAVGDLSGVNDLVSDDGIYYDITGIASNETMLVINGFTVPAEEYFYWLAYNCSNLEYTILAYNTYYGMYANLVNEDGSVNWTADFTADMTLAEYAMQQAERSAVFHIVTEEAAAAYTDGLSGDAGKELDSYIASTIAQSGGEEAFANQLATLGISRSTYDKLAASNFLYDKLVEQVLTEGSELYVPDEEYLDQATFADHILLATGDPSTGESYSQDTVDAKYALAQELLERLRGSDDPVALFAQLADEFSDDGGRTTNPYGYIYTPGTMVSEFENAASALQPGEFSDIVTSTYGYHIILRKDLLEGFTLYPAEKTALAETHVTELLNDLADKAEVEQADVLDSLDVALFYTDYTAVLQAITDTADTAEQAE